MPISTAQKKKGAPTRQSDGGRCDTMPSIGAPIIGAITADRLDSEATAPIDCPCVLGAAAFETMLCMADATAKPSRLNAITAYIIQPSVARPHRKYASVLDTNPMRASFGAPRRAISFCNRKPCTNTEATPTANSDQPFSCGVQP